MTMQQNPERPTDESSGYASERHIAAPVKGTSLSATNLSYKYDPRKHLLGRPPPGSDGITEERELVLKNVYLHYKFQSFIR